MTGIAVQGRHKLLKGGVAIGNNVRSQTAAKFLSIREIIPSTKVFQHHLQSSGRALVATYHPFAVGYYCNPW